MCELCEHKRITEHKYEDDLCWVAKCSTHEGQWMVVLSAHRSQPTRREMAHITAVLDQLFNVGGWRLRGYMSKLLQHWHDHIEMGRGEMSLHESDRQ